MTYSTADLKLENVLFVHNTLEKHTVSHRGKDVRVSVPVNRRIKRNDSLFVILHTSHVICTTFASQ